MSLRNNKKKNKNLPKAGKKEKRSFVDILRDDDFSEYVNFLRSPWKTFFFNFLRGTGFGLGTILGTAIVLTILLYIFSLFTDTPFLGDWFRSIIVNLKK